VFENRVLRRIFGPKWDEMCDEELRNLYSSPNIIRMIFKEDEMGRAFSKNDEVNACGVFVEKPEVERPLGRPKCTRVVDIMMNLREIELDGLN
jgi:hypothetical protein